MFQLISSYPKSGNTYVRIFLSHYLTGNEDLNHIGFPIFSSRAHFPLYMPSRGNLLPFDETRIAKTHEIADGFSGRFVDRAIHIIRNPLDVVLSYSRHMAISIDDAITALGNERNHLTGNAFIYPQKLSSWSTHTLSWLKQKKFPVLIVRYESLVTSPRMVLSGLLQFLGLTIVESKMNAALSYSSLTNLQNMESKMLAASIEAGETRDLTVPKTGPTKIAFKEARGSTGKFFNVGRYNQWRDKLSADQIARILYDHGQVMELLGYAKKG